MTTGKITKPTLDALVDGGVAGFLWDQELKGFGLKTTANGSASYVVQYRLGGREAKTKRYTIGHGSPWTPVTARSEAPRLLIRHRPCLFPQAAASRSSRFGILDYADRFAGSCVGKGWAAMVQRSLRLHIKPVLRDKALPTISRTDVVAVFDRLQASQMANRRNVFAVLRRHGLAWPAFISGTSGGQRSAKR
jgi:hypothetical protein